MSPAVSSPHQRVRQTMTLPEMQEWGRAFGTALRAPALVALSGELGAGKTTLVRAICAGYGSVDPVTSPTFTLVHRYEAKRSRMYHIDLYRLERPAELTQLGWDEMLAERAVVLVEWPERAAGAIPADRIAITLEHDVEHPDRRVLVIT